MIINPRSGGGLSESRWARLVEGLTDGLGPFDSVFTKAPRDATDIARREAQAGRKLVIAFGGDGTISETANGILAAGAGATTELGIIPRGTGGDLRRTLGLPEDLGEAARHVKEAPARPVDVGRVTFVGHDGTTQTQHFLNVSSFGYSSAVASRANSASKRFGAKMAFVGAAVRTLLSYDNTDVWLTLDEGPRERRRVMLTAVGNGRYFGGGMKICPNAKLDSGTLDVVIVGDFTRGDVVTKGSRLYDGSHLSLDLVKNVTARKLVAAPVEADAVIPVELDGETPGRLPATYEILPGALLLRA